VDFSHDGKYLASTSRDCSIVIWIRESQAGGTFKLFKIISNFASTVYHVSWSPDGKILAACDEENNITLWNAMVRDHLSNVTTCRRVLC
jgi:WD40 repeat protein